MPIPLGDGLFKVDGTWGRIQPAELAPGVRTLGELEVIDHIQRSKPLIDTRLEGFFRQGTIPGARGVPHDQILQHLDELDRTVETIFFCNGPQCLATPDAVRQLLESGYPSHAILYYRGGMHDWMTLGFPLVTEPESQATSRGEGADSWLARARLEEKPSERAGTNATPARDLRNV